MPEEVPFLLYLAPLFMGFEAWQLVIAERHLGVKHIERNLDPRDHGPGERLAFLWSGSIVVYWVWMLLLLIPPFGRAQVVCMLAISMLGYSLRRSVGLKWILVILTLEGAVRIGMIISLLASAWRAL